MPFTILAEGRFARDRVLFEWSDSPRETLPEIEHLIHLEWSRRTQDARRTGQILFNGALACYVDHETRDGVLRITVGPTNYRDFVGTNLYNNHRVSDFGWHRFANPLGITGLIVCRDDWIVLGRRSHRVAFHGGYLHTIGGALEAQDCADRERIDAFSAVLRELREEVGLEESEIGGIECIGLVRDTQIRQPELLFVVRARLSADTIRDRLDPEHPEQEHVGLEFCLNGPADVIPFIQNAAPVAPVAIAAIMLYGKLTWGDEWYADAAGAS